MSNPCSIRSGLATYRFGSGDPILFMPGPHRFERPGLRTADMLIEGFTALGRRVITFDPPGSGRSTRSARLGMEEMHDCADEALAASDVTGPVDAVGHSMGGLAVLAYAIQRPGRVKRLVLIGTGAGRPSYMTAPGALWNRGHPHFLRLACLAILHIVWPRLGPERLLNNFVRRESFRDPQLADQRPVSVGDWFRAREGRTDWHRIAKKLDYTQRLGEVDVPALVACGRHDPQFPPACSEALARGLRHARLILFADSGHFPYIEEAGRFWPLVAAFLA